MGCEHSKERGHKWCRPCAEEKAGPKPAKTWAPGYYALNREDEPGVVRAVHVTLYGIATDDPKWGEDLTIDYPGGGSSKGHKDFFTRLIVAPDGWDRTANARETKA